MFKVKLYHHRSYIIKLETMLTWRRSCGKSPSIWMSRTLYVILNWNDCFPRNWCNTDRKVAQNSLSCRKFLITYNCVSSRRSFTERIFMAAINILYIFLPSLQQFLSWIWVEVRSVRPFSCFWHTTFSSMIRNFLYLSFLFLLFFSWQML